MAIIKQDFGEINSSDAIIEHGSATSGTTSVTFSKLTSKPDILTLYAPSTSAASRFCIDNYYADWSTSTLYEQLSENGYSYTLPINNAYGINNITDSGFTVGNGVGAFTWVAIKFK